MEQISREKSLYQAIEVNDLQQVKRLAALGLSSDFSNEYACSPLEFAIQVGSSKELQAVLERAMQACQQRLGGQLLAYLDEDLVF
jgi:hypothetical protein